MAASRKTTDQRLETLRQKQERLQARMSALEAQKKTEDRRRQTRRAFVVGAAVLERAEADPAFRDCLRSALQAAALRDSDRAVIADLLSLQIPPPAAEPALEPSAQTEAA